MKKDIEADFEVPEDFVPDTQPVIVVKDVKTTGLSSDDLRRRILQLMDDVRENYLELSQCLFEAFTRHKSWGFPTFKEYAQKELGVKYGKASYLKNIWAHFGKDEELLQKVKSVGWDKMKELCRVVTHENANEWVQKANLLSCDDLKKEIKSFMKNKVPDDAKGMLENESDVRGTPIENQLHSQTFQFSYDSKGAVLTAIEKVKTETGVSASEALALICAEYTGSASQGQGNDFMLDNIKRYENNSSLRFIVVDTDINDLVHGRDLLETLVRNALENENGEG